MNLEFSIDWLNFTALSQGVRTFPQVPYPMVDANWSPGLPARGYTSALHSAYDTRVSWHSNRADMGTHVQYSGTCINKHGILGITPKMIAMHHDKHGDRCTRIDLAIDCHESRLNIKRLAGLVAANKGKFSSKVYSHIVSNEGGQTLYLGSRTSDLYLRVYNKAAQTETSGDWVRIELECKGTRAHEIGRKLARNSDEGMIMLTRGLIKHQAAFDDALWSDIVGEFAISIAKAQVKEHDRKAWLLGLVAPAMGKYIRDTGDNDVVEQFLAIVDAFTRFG